MCNTSLLNFIGGVICPIAKIDRNKDNKARGQFARLAIFVDLGQPLISNIKINDRIQRVEYESLSMVCFYCGRYSNNQEICPYKSGQDTTSMIDVNQLPRETSGVPKCVEEERYGPWMLVERRQKKGVKLVLAKTGRATVVGERNGTRFESLSGDLEGLAKRQVAGKLKARNKIRAYDEPSLTVTTVMNESIHGMCSHNGENSRLMDDEVEDDDSSDESLADAEET
ncbi:hypothetical protein Gotur_000108 [Gossypium turneri]